MTTPAASGVAAWHAIFHLEASDQMIAALDKLLHDDVVFHSPVVHRPIEGKLAAAMYLQAASKVLVNEHWTYAREMIDGAHAGLEFLTVVDGITINGIDLITFDADGKITDFKVMVRPMKAVEKLREFMQNALAQLAPSS